MKSFFLLALLFITSVAQALDPVLLPKTCSVQYTVPDVERNSFFLSLTDSLQVAGLIHQGRDHKLYSVSQAIKSPSGTIKYSVAIFSTKQGYLVRFFSHSKPRQGTEMLAAILTDFNSRINL